MDLRKVLIGVGATVVDILGFIVISAICQAIIGEDFVNVAGPIVFWFTVAVAIAAYLLCGGLKVALSTVWKSFRIGMLFPIWPINWACGLIVGAIALMVVWLLPIVAILMNGLLYGEE